MCGLPAGELHAIDAVRDLTQPLDAHRALLQIIVVYSTRPSGRSPMVGRRPNCRAARARPVTDRAASEATLREMGSSLDQLDDSLALGAYRGRELRRINTVLDAGGRFVLVLPLPIEARRGDDIEVWSRVSMPTSWRTNGASRFTYQRANSQEPSCHIAQTSNARSGVKKRRVSFCQTSGTRSRSRRGGVAARRATSSARRTQRDRRPAGAGTRSRGAMGEVQDESLIRVLDAGHRVPAGGHVVITRDIADDDRLCRLPAVLSHRAMSP
jgi:hypothetical protein